MFKVNNKNTSVSIVDFEQMLAGSISHWYRYIFP